MQPLYKKYFKRILSGIALFILGVVLSILTEDFYRTSIRFLIKFFKGDKIIFTGKDFHLFISIHYIIAMGLFTTFIYFLFSQNFYQKKMRGLLLIPIVFLLTLFSVVIIHSTLLIMICTACNDGVRYLPFREIAYDFYFPASVVVTIFALLLDAYFQYKIYDDLIGLWSSVDDGSGLIQFFGWSVEFNKDGTGIYHQWSSLEKINFSFKFLWKRLTKDSINLKVEKETTWNSIQYVIAETIGAYNSRQYQLTEKNKTSFWTSSEPLFKRKK